MTAPDLAMLETYFRMMNSNGAAQVYRAALDAGILSALEEGLLAAEQVAAACNAQTRPTGLLLEALEAMGLVEDQGATYSLAPVSRLLLGGEYRELGDQYWRHLPDYLRAGVPLKKMDDVAQSEAHYQSQAAVLGWMLTPAAQAAAETLGKRASQRGLGGLAILDVGAGSAVWSLNLARRDPQSQVTAVDWPAVLEVAAETAAELGLSDRLTTIAGDWQEVELPAAAFDLAIVANLTHLQTPDRNEALFRKVHGALQASGEIVVVDAFPGSSAGDIPFALYQLGLALRTQQGRVFTVDELQRMLAKEGFAPGELVPLDVPPYMVGMLVAKKRGG